MKKNGEVSHFPGWGWRKNLMIMKLSIFLLVYRSYNRWLRSIPSR